MSLEVGTAYARLGAHLDEDGFDRYDRRIREARHEGDRGATAKLHAEADTRGFDRYDRSVRDVNRGHEDLVRGSGRVRTAMGSLYLGGAGVAGAGLAMGLLAKGALASVDAFQESEIVARRQALVIRTMGTDAGATAEHVNALASAMEKKTGVDDDTIIAGANVLRTFKGIRNEAGKGNDVFDRTTKVALDLSSALGTDLQSANIQLGKALAEPAKGAAALSRSGSVLKGDVEKLKEMAKSGVPILEQQKFLLSAVEKQVKGTAESNSTATSRMKAQWGELQEAIGKTIAPAVDAVAGKLNGFIQGLINGSGAGGRFRDAVVTAFKEVRGVVTDVVEWVVGAVHTLANDKSVQTFAATAIRFIKDLASTVSDVVTYIVRSVRSVGPELTTIGHAIAAVAGFILEGFRKTLPAIKRTIEGLVDVFRGLVKVVAGILSLDFGKVWEGLKATVGGALKSIIGLTEQYIAPFRQAFGALFGGLAHVAAGAWDLVTGIVKKGLSFLLGGVSTVLGVLATAADAASHLPFIGGKFKGLADDIRGAQHSIDGFRDSLRKTDNDAAPMTKAMGLAATRVIDLKDRLKNLKKGTDDYRQTARALRGAQNDLNDELRKADAAGRKGARGIRSIGSGAGSAAGAVADASVAIAANVDQLARKLGAQGITFRPARSAAGRQNQNDAYGSIGDYDFNGLGAARGAHIVGGDPRARGGDDRVLLGADGRPEAVVGAGELLVFNGDQQAAISKALATTYGVGLDQFFAAGWRPHYAQAYAGGGRVADWALSGPDGGYKRDGNAALRVMDRAAEARVHKLEAEPVQRMIRAGRTAGAAFPNYVYGGGHGGFHGPFDCSGYVSYILHAGGLLNGGPVTTDSLKGYGQAGDGNRVTIGVRGSTGRSAHTMMKVGNTFFEAGGHGVGERGGWDGVFPIHRHPGGYAAGGRIGARRRRVAWDELPEHIRRRVRENPGTLDESHPDFVGFGLAAGGRLPALARGGRFGASTGLTGWETRISEAERRYGQDDRRFGQSEETFVVEDEFGSHIDERAVHHRTHELGVLRDERAAILNMQKQYREAALQALEHYRAARRRVAKALRAVQTGKGKKAKERAKTKRAGYRTALENYGGRISDLEGTARSLAGDAIDSRLDLGDLANEARALDPKVLLPGAHPAGKTFRVDNPVDVPTTDTPDDGSSSSSSDTPTAPTAEDIAAGVANALASFNAGRADLFGHYGANFMGAGTLARIGAGGGTPDELAAGSRYFGGASSGSDGGVLQAAGDVNLNVQFAGPQPADPHTFTQAALYELKAAI